MRPRRGGRKHCDTENGMNRQHKKSRECSVRYFARSYQVLPMTRLSQIDCNVLLNWVDRRLAVDGRLSEADSASSHETTHRRGVSHSGMGAKSVRHGVPYETNHKLEPAAQCACSALTCATSLPCPALPCPLLSSPALSSPARTCPALRCAAMPCRADACSSQTKTGPILAIAGPT